MKRVFQIIKPFVFIAIFCILFINVSYILRYESDIKERFMGFYAEENNTIDMVMIGSSPVHPYWGGVLAYNEYGFTSYPLSTNNQNPAVMKYIIREAEKTQSPRLYVCEVRMFTYTQEYFDNKGDSIIRNVTDNLKYSANRVNLINDIISSKGGSRLPYYFDIMKYHSNWKNCLNAEFLKQGDYEEKSNLKGFLFEPSINEIEKNDFKSVKDEKPIPTEQEKILRELLSEIKEKNLNALFVVAPFEMNENNHKMSNYMGRIIEEAGYEYLDFNNMYDELGIDFCMDFYNAGHMNIFGAEKYTKWLGHYISENYDLPDHRGDDSYSDWDESYKVWSKQAEETKEAIYKLLEKQGEQKQGE